MRLDLQTALNDFGQLDTFLFFTKNEEPKDNCNADNNSVLKRTSRDISTGQSSLLQAIQLLLNFSIGITRLYRWRISHYKKRLIKSLSGDAINVDNQNDLPSRFLQFISL